ncbi:IS3 family transposase [Hymenobacter nivis]|uniref:HTH-like domain-containing protein n=1 Tax=Hymenobacter nivis TaxID=1850093 RepID=A0A2Z3GFI5_9BACT|nr:hypothetical protein DDQ68_06625 [Hymenobacter nivis]
MASWQVAAQHVFITHAHRYGQRRLRAPLQREGHAVGRCRLRRRMVTSGLCTLIAPLPVPHARPRQPRRLWLPPTNSPAGPRPRPPINFGSATAPA